MQNTACYLSERKWPTNLMSYSSIVKEVRLWQLLKYDALGEQVTIFTARIKFDYQATKLAE